jgi:exodeoxyribonuclease-5
MTDLSKQQDEALAAIVDWFAGQQDWTTEPFRLFGPAGTGKTTLAREVGPALGVQPIFAAYTGKAANVLRSKGCQPAGTLHSLIYKPVSNSETKRKLADRQRALEQARGITDGAPSVAETIEALEAEVAALEKQVTTIGWEWNPDSALADAALLILDEVSMVDRKLADDVERFGTPVLVLGDPEQLEPVGGEGYYTNAAPDYSLTEIHRQALDSPVLELATRIRTSKDRRLGMTAADLTDHDIDLAMKHDQILCWRNATRWMAVGKLRARMGLPAGQVAPGDRIMCLANNKDLGVFNGQQFYVLSADPGPLGPTLTVREIPDGPERTILAFNSGFQGEAEEKAAKQRWEGGKGNRMLATFAQAITVHKSQGSEWPAVYVVNETPGMIAMTASRKGEEEAITQARRWLYTAVTRASDRVTITKPRGR